MKTARPRALVGRTTWCLCLLLTSSCAILDDVVFRTEQRTLLKKSRQDPKNTFLVLTERKPGNSLEVTVLEACERVPVLEKDEVKYIRKVNQSVGADVAWGLTGGALLGLGSGFTVDATALAPNDRLLQPIDTDVALGVGIGAIVAGAGLLLIPIVDAARAAQTREEHRPYQEDGKPLAAAEECGSRGALPGAVEVGAEGQLPVVDITFEGDAQPWERKHVAAPNLGTTSVDLEQLVPDSVLRRAPRPAKLSLGMGGVVVAQVDTSPVFDALDDRAWESLAAPRMTCSKPDSLDDCDQIETYSKSYPASRHAVAARALIDGAQPAFIAMRDDLAYAKADPKGCEKGQTEDACDGLYRYLRAWPTGRHVAEAKAVLKVGEPKLARLVVKGCPRGMLAVPGGTFNMGDAMRGGSAGEPLVRVGTKATVRAFCMGKHEVTVKAYAECVAVGRCTAAGTSSTLANGGSACNGGVGGKDDHPINCVDWNQAAAFCAWKGWRLPTEAEWEFGARGTDGRMFPWVLPSDRSWTEWSCSGQRNNSGTVGRTGTCAVGSFPKDVSPFGLYDMAANVAEWTSTRTLLSYYTSESTERGVKGGAWNHPLLGHYILSGSHRTISDRLPSVGFRCAK